MFDNFPFSNFHELNMDWLIKAMEKLKSNIESVAGQIAGKQDKLPTGTEGQLLTWHGGRALWRPWVDPRPEPPSMSQIIDTLYPQGSIYITAEDRDPNELFPGTTWIEIKDKFILASGDDHEVLEEGGRELLTLTVDNMPSHQHVFSGINTLYSGPEEWGPQIAYTRTSPWQTQLTGGGAPFSIMPPYVTFNVWRRTA